MPRNKQFAPEREPLSAIDSLQLQDAHGPLSFLNPTIARYHYEHPSKSDSQGLTPNNLSDDAHKTDISKSARRQKGEQYASRVGYRWTSRNNRKGRHQLVVSPETDATKAKYEVPEPTNTFRHSLRVILRMFTYFPVWDVSWIVAYIFTWGSVVWVINAFFVFIPLVGPSTEFDNEIYIGGGVTAFIGATIFELGSFFLMLEAVNENRTGDFGWAVQRAYKDYRRGSQPNGNRSSSGSDVEEGAVLRISPGNCSHHHTNRRNLVGKAKRTIASTEEGLTEQDPHGNTGWVWFPSWLNLRTHYFHELGFLACLSQLFGATIFWISGVTVLPGIQNHLSNGLEAGIYWTPQVVGGIGFIISGTLFMIETQKTWYLPAYNVLGWHIGLWNLIGGIGFTLCPAFGYSKQSWAQYQASCSTFWGSWAFLIGSLIQLYESLEKNPVQVETPKDLIDDVTQPESMVAS